VPRVRLLGEDSRDEVAGGQAQEVHLDVGMRLVELGEVDAHVVLLERRVDGDVAGARAEREGGERERRQRVEPADAGHLEPPWSDGRCRTGHRVAVVRQTAIGTPGDDSTPMCRSQ
jgi:hypothetical protein